MRRLLLILLAWMALMPMLPAGAHVSRDRHTACAACPATAHRDTGHRDTGVVDHGCIGCATAPEATAVLDARSIARSAAPLAAPAAIPTHHRPGFDPPPPRAVG